MICNSIELSIRIFSPIIADKILSGFTNPYTHDRRMAYPPGRAGNIYFRYSTVKVEIFFSKFPFFQSVKECASRAQRQIMLA